MQHELTWEENGQSITQIWLSESAFSPPKRVLVAEDTLTADEFYQQASQGAAFVWKGDFQNAKQLLQAVKRRIDKKSRSDSDSRTPSEQFHRHRQSQAHRAQLLSRLLICIEPNLSIDLRRAPDVSQAISSALPSVPREFVLSLRELLGMIGAHEWRKKGVLVPALGEKIFPHYGVFSPARGEYLELIEKAPLPSGVSRAFDIGTGTGVIAALLAKRGIPKIIATETDPRALACARENMSRLGLENQVEIVEIDLFH
jgi:methylase of polypeptide subunit release factors